MSSLNDSLRDQKKPDENLEKGNKVKFGVQRIYTKYTLFDSPQAPLIFKQDWQPQTQYELMTNIVEEQENHYEVTLTIKLIVTLQGQKAFETVVKQAGMFLIEEAEKQQKEIVLNVLCPSVLFPYLGSTIANLITQAGLPPIHLAPLNFEALYQEKLKQQKEKKKQEKTTDKVASVKEEPAITH